jgi:hypothetical protein
MPTNAKVNTRLEAAIRALLFDQPIAYHPVIARAVGSVSAGVLLSQLLYWTPRTEDPDGWFYKTRDELHAETALTRYEQESARKALKKLGILEEAVRGLPAKIYFRINVDALTALLATVQVAENQPPRWSRRYPQGGGKPATSAAENQPPFTEITSETTTEITNRDYSPSNSKGAAPQILADEQDMRNDEADTAALTSQTSALSREDPSPAPGMADVRRVLADRGLAPACSEVPEQTAPAAARGFARAGTVLNDTSDELLSDEDLDRLRAELAEVADELGDTAPAQSTLTRVVGYFRSVDMDIDGFTRCIHVAHSRTKEDLHTGRVREKSKAFAYFLTLLKQESELRARQGVGKKRRSLAGKYARYVRR